MNEILLLISETFTTDSIGQRIAQETSRQVFCDRGSISKQEWYDAGIKGLQPQYKFIIPQLDYNDEELVEYNGTRYAVYRTYLTDNDTVELYVEKKAGI